MADVFVEAGKRTGRTLANERQMIAAMNRGDRVFTKLNGVWFAAEADAGGVAYTALTEKPAGLPL